MFNENIMAYMQETHTTAKLNRILVYKTDVTSTDIKSQQLQLGQNQESMLQDNLL